MSIDYRYQGEIGQKLAEALLLRFLTPARPEPDPGIDAIGHLRMQSSDPVCFNFQFKTGDFSVETDTLGKWISVLEREPVVLLHIRILSIQQQEYRFLMLHSWMLHNPEWPDKLAIQGKIKFNLDDFQLVDLEGQNFQNALEDERDRILKKQTIWRTRNSLLVPISETDLFRHFGALGSMEIPAIVLNEAKMMPETLTVEIDLWRLLHNIWSLPEKYQQQAMGLPGIRNWLNSRMTPIAPKYKQWERKQFQKFVRAMEGILSGNKISLPSFTYKEISCWRIFVQLFPESIRILNRVSQYPEAHQPQELMAASLLSSTLASADDDVLSGKARNLLRRMQSVANNAKLYDYRQYRVVRQIRFSVTEADGSEKAVQETIDFVHSHPKEWDSLLNRRYYRDTTDVSLVRSTIRKLERPKPRDLRTARVSEFFLERFPKSLVDEVRKAVHANEA
jgi:hypothetical protein